ncbi:MAG: hypothetical protein JST04_06315 [Bdellovibrionales bacterium]|nr:hypothetical protein [Bdellovibrionales bacterium]
MAIPRIAASFGFGLLAVAALSAPVSPAFGGEEDLRVLVRGGCLDEANCCFGKWKMASDADVYQTDDAIDKIATVKAGQEVEASSGRVHSDPGRLKVVFKHGEWKKGQIIGLYSEPNEDGIAKIGTAITTADEKVPFLKKGSKCEKPSKDCWAIELSKPKVKWLIKIKLPDDHSGWVESTHVQTDSECRL